MKVETLLVPTVFIYTKTYQKTMPSAGIHGKVSQREAYNRQTRHQMLEAFIYSLHRDSHTEVFERLVAARQLMCDLWRSLTLSVNRHGSQESKATTCLSGNLDFFPRVCLVIAIRNLRWIFGWGPGPVQFPGGGNQCKVDFPLLGFAWLRLAALLEIVFGIGDPPGFFMTIVGVLVIPTSQFNKPCIMANVSSRSPAARP